MAEYIERVPFAGLIEHLDKKELCKNCYHRAACDAWVRNATTLYDDYIYSVENCPYYKPTADVVEVKHGKWRLETDEEMPNPMFKLVVCSVCNSTANGTYNYCPNCGAKMDKRSDTE